ncbi:MAG: MFS transporter, partial [Gammaproteobacteria bacterium]|nr:MFS transporter [Gammaproteobacteria bacterium]
MGLAIYVNSQSCLFFIRHPVSQFSPRGSPACPMLEALQRLTRIKEMIDNSMFSNQKTSRIYRLLVNEEDARVCTDISGEACRVVPGNFLLQVLTQFLTKLGDAIANPKTVLAWLMSALAAPTALIAFLVPIRESGSLLPQLLIAAWVRQQPIRKWTFVIGCVLQGLAVAAMGIVAVTLD